MIILILSQLLYLKVSQGLVDIKPKGVIKYKPVSMLFSEVLSF